NVVRLHGIPENIVSDRGSQFVSRFWRTFCAKMGIDLSFSSAFHPQTNGQTERTNQTLETYLRCFVSADQDDWVTFLPLAEFALNNRASSATLVSPFFCNSGFHPRFSSGQVEPSDCPGVDMVVDGLHRIWSHVVDNLKLSQEKAQQFANRRRRVGPRLRVGDLVWLSSRFVPMKVSSPKFKPRFIGPYRILEILNPVSFRLDLPASFAIHNVFHRSLLRRSNVLRNAQLRNSLKKQRAAKRALECEVKAQERQHEHRVHYGALDSEDPVPKEVKDIAPQTTEILLEALEKWTEYRITVVAHTAVGPGPESSPIVVRTDEDVPSAPPRKVEAEVLNSTAIKVFWRSPIQNRQHGQIRGYQIHYVKMENGEAKGLPYIRDVMLADAQVRNLGKISIL
ncbi:unnamed protein product, partial [Ranitomeya imitator]